MTRSKLFALAGISAALTLVACGGGSGGSSGTHDTMTLGQAQEVSSGIENLVNGSFTAAALFDLSADGTLTDPTLAPGANAHLVTRNPVMAYDLEQPFRSTVLSFMPGNDAIEICSAPS